MYSPNNIQELLRSYIAKYEAAGFGHEIWVLLTFFVFLAWFYLLWSVSSDNRIQKPKAYFLIVATLLLWGLYQIPNLAQYTVHINECQHIAEGNRIVEYPVFWKQLDGTTLGPLPIYYLGFFKVIGIPLDYFTIKLLNFSIWGFILYVIYKLFRQRFNRRDSIVFLSPLATVVIFFSNHDYLGYNGEPMTVLLLTIAVYLISKLVSNNTGSVKITEFWLGMVLVAIPFAKFQGGPIAFALGLYYLIYLLRNKKSLTPVLSGVAVVLAVVFILLVTTDALYDFWQSFIMNNISYASTSEGLNSQKGIFVRFLKLILTVFGASETRVLFIIALVLMIYETRNIISSFKSNQFKSTFLSNEQFFFFFLLISILVVYVPGNVFYHYALFLPVPALLFIIFSLRKIDWVEQLLKNRAILIILVLIPGTMLIFNGNEIFAELAGGHKKEASEVVQYLRDNGRKNDKLALWGWESCIYPNTGLIMATRESQTQRQILSPNQQNYYLKRYLEDLSNEKPRFFLDTTKRNNWILDFDKHNYSNYPDLHAFIEANYCLIMNTEGMLLFELCMAKTK